MPATASAAIAAFEVVFFGETFVTFGRVIEIFAFCWLIFIILLLHKRKFINLERMFVIVSRFLIPKGYRGMAVFPFVILRNRADVANAVLMNHEKIHLRQQIELLVVPFFVVYGLDFLLKLTLYRDRHTAYRNIVFEREAYANEKDLTYLKSRPVWKLLKFKQL